MKWYIEGLKKYATFSGRASRSEYWMFVLFNLIFAIVAIVLDRVAGTDGIIYSVYVLGILLPSMGVAIRRLHDTNRSGWRILMSLIPLIGGILLIVWVCQDSDAGDNQYGANPKGGNT
ncbi:MAG: DUF805 domain-containing protein [Opitutales bacterium]|jgi:uncharacterized membrane protein YhaH (DUF805 family)|nr:DUF805 domain-containing protein [Opitutales bacterium]